MSTRFAILPAGNLTIAQARIALANRDLGGGFILRLDDLSSHDEAAAERIRQDLRWLGIGWGSEIRQSGRRARYAEAVAQLQANGALYPCFENPDELRIKRDRRAREGKSLVYDRAALRMTAAQRATAEAKGLRPHWRFRLPDGEVTWKDRHLGPQSVKLPAISDPILLDVDGIPRPMLAGAIDDLDLGITAIVRAADDTAASAIETCIRARLAPRAPAIARGHLPALRATGQASRARDLERRPIRQFRQDGIEGAVLARYLSALTADPGFDPAALLTANRAALAALPFADVAARLPAAATEEFWLAVRGQIDLLSEAREMWLDRAH